MRKLILIAKVRLSACAKFAQETHLIGGGPPRGAAKPCFSLSENTRRRMILYQRDQVVHCSRPLSPFPSPFSLLLSYHSLSLSLSHSFILSPYFSLSFSPSISLCVISLCVIFPQISHDQSVARSRVYSRLCIIFMKIHRTHVRTRTTSNDNNLYRAKDNNEEEGTRQCFHRQLK